MIPNSFIIYLILKFQQKNKFLLAHQSPSTRAFEKFREFQIGPPQFQPRARESPNRVVK
jgi:hypothetical protein